MFKMAIFCTFDQKPPIGGFTQNLVLGYRGRKRNCLRKLCGDRLRDTEIVGVEYQWFPLTKLVPVILTLCCRYRTTSHHDTIQERSNPIQYMI